MQCERFYNLQSRTSSIYELFLYKILYYGETLSERSGEVYRVEL